MRELSEMAVKVRGIEDFQSLADLPMELCSATPRRPQVGDFADEGVGEANTADRAGNLRDDTRLHRLVEQLEDGATRESADGRQRIEIELAAERCGHGEQPVAFV